MTGQSYEWLRRRGIENETIIKAMGIVPRDQFYSDSVVEDGLDAHSSRLDGITITPPEIVARMIEALSLTNDDVVLHVGTGSGYIPAILSQLSSAVFTVEKDPNYAVVARDRLDDLEFNNVQVLFGKTLGEYARNGPYDAILVSAGMGQIPDRLARRLSVGGVLVAPIGSGKSQKLMRCTRVGDEEFETESLGDLKVMPLLGDILVDMGVVDREEVELAALEADVHGLKLGEALLQGQHVTETDIFAALAAQYGREVLSAKEVLKSIESTALGSIPRSFLSHHRLIPIDHQNGVLRVATTAAATEATELARALGIPSVSVSLITPSDYDIVWSSIERRRSVANTVEKPEETFVELSAESIAMFEGILSNAIANRASDVHFERYENTVTIRFRIDGVLVNRNDHQLTLDELGEVAHLVKVSARLDPHLRRLPQSGHFQRRIGGRVFDVRATMQPTFFGEDVSLRILPQEAQVRTLEELGFRPIVAAQFRVAIKRRSGVIVVVGPNGAGRSTTVFAGVKALIESGPAKVVSIENPVSYTLKGVQQLRVQDESGMSKSAAIQLAMSSDADVIIVDGIENKDIADQVLSASRAGHLVIASMSGRSFVDVLFRFREWQVPWNGMASEFNAVVSQRLVRRLCVECRELSDADPMVASALGVKTGEDLRAYVGLGCTHCGESGYRGRIAVAEVVDFTNAGMRDGLRSGVTAGQIRAMSDNAGTVGLRETLAELIKMGIISQDDVPVMDLR